MRPIAFTQAGAARKCGLLERSGPTSRYVLLRVKVWRRSELVLCADGIDGRVDRVHVRVVSSDGIVHGHASE